jgi:hypothetical protein
MCNIFQGVQTKHVGKKTQEWRFQRRSEIAIGTQIFIHGTNDYRWPWQHSSSWYARWNCTKEHISIFGHCRWRYCTGEKSLPLQPVKYILKNEIDLRRYEKLHALVLNANSLKQIRPILSAFGIPNRIFMAFQQQKLRVTFEV